MIGRTARRTGTRTRPSVKSWRLILTGEVGPVNLVGLRALTRGPVDHVRGSTPAGRILFLIVHPRTTPPYNKLFYGGLEIEKVTSTELYFLIYDLARLYCLRLKIKAV